MVTTNSTDHKCLLCKTPEVNTFYQGTHRGYLQCPTCNLVFASPVHFLSTEEEKARYELHRNSPDDAGYRTFLNRLFTPMNALLPPQSRGLDFGSGTGPTLSVMFEEAGHTMAIYDHYFANDTSVFDKQYDFITATEVVEHLFNPGKELSRLWSCLKPGGRMGIMTKLVINHAAFTRWHYKIDPTHVCFFSRQTFEWLASGWQADIHFSDNDVILLYKKIL